GVGFSCQRATKDTAVSSRGGRGRSARLPEGASSLNAEERPNYYGSSTATGMGVAGTPIGATELGGVKRSTDMYRQPYGAVTSAPGSRYTSRIRSTRLTIQ